MTIQEYAENLKTRLQQEVKKLAPSDDVVGTGKMLSAIREILRELKDFTSRYKFTSSQEEILFFKEIKPVFMSQYLFHKKVFSFQVYDSFRDAEGSVENYRRSLRKLEKFAVKNQQFYQYCLSGDTTFDPIYFTRNKRNLPHIDRDELFTTGYDRTLSKILAHELLRDYIQSNLAGLRERQYEGRLDGGIAWTDSKVALVELIYALHSAGVFNHGKADLKNIVAVLEQMFRIDVGNYARIWSEIRIRKSGQTNFLDQLKSNYLKFINTLT